VLASIGKEFCRESEIDRRRRTCGSPVYTLMNIIIDELPGIQLRAVQSRGGARRGVEQKPLVNSGNIAEGRKIVLVGDCRSRSLPVLRGRRAVATVDRRKERGELHARCILARSTTKQQTDKQVYRRRRSWCGVFDVS